MRSLSLHWSDVLNALTFEGTGLQLPETMPTAGRWNSTWRQLSQAIRSLASRGGGDLAAIGDDPTVYHTMNGPSEFHCIGTIRTWPIAWTESTPISSRYDEAHGGGRSAVR